MSFGTALLAFLALGVHAVSAARAVVQDTGRTLTLDGISYFVPPSPVSAVHNTLALSALKGAELVPFSVIPTSNIVFDEAALQETVNIWSAQDDVWTESFLTGRSHLIMSSFYHIELFCASCLHII